MNIIRPALLLLPFVAAACLGQSCNPHPMRPDGRAPCPTIAGQLSKAADASAGFKKDLGVMNTGIAGARANFFKLYPNGPGVTAAETTFLNALQDKDLYYLMFSLPEGTTGRMAVMPNLIDLNPSTTRDSLGSFPTNMDGGIPKFAFPLFVAWVDALRRNTGREHDGDMASPLLITSAIQDKSHYRQAYEDARNWSEFITSNLDLSNTFTPRVYILNQMEEGVARVLALPKPADIPDPTAATKALYDQFVRMFGEQAVLSAASTVLHSPRNNIGGLATQASITIGTYTSHSYNPYMHFLSTLTASSPRNYAMALCVDRTMMMESAVGAFNTLSFWQKAADNYGKIVSTYGESNVIAAAGRLKDAPKDDDRLRGDPEAKQTILWFDALLKNPKTELPSIYGFKVSSYDPRWMGKLLEARGTVSRVDLDQSGLPHYLTIHFKESPNDKLMAFTPAAAEWQQVFGPNLQSLVGKPVIVYGEIRDWRTGSGVRIYDNIGIRVISPSELTSFHDSTPTWLAAPSSSGTSTATVAENPKYRAWKKFSPGATAAYDEYLLMETGPDTNQFNRTKLARIVFKLESIDSETAVVTCESMTNGKPSSTKFYYKARTAAEAPYPSTVQVSNGQEQLNIGGKSIATTWESHGPASDPKSFYKTWTSDEIPGGLAQQSNQQFSSMGNRRNITLTTWESTQGTDPFLNPQPSAASPSKTAASSAPPADINQRYRADMNRLDPERTKLMQLLRSHPSATDLRNANNQLAAQLNNLSAATRAQDPVQTRKILEQIESIFTFIENYSN